MGCYARLSRTHPFYFITESDIQITIDGFDNRLGKYFGYKY
jgi:hypothetical protein